jgi:molecular chaperone GrpE
VGQFVALRHEVHLQTRAARSQQEQNAETLRQLSQALESLRQARSGARDEDRRTEDERWRPLLKALLDLADMLELAQGEVKRGRTDLLVYLDEFSATAAAAAALSPPEPRPGLWARWFGREQPKPAGPALGPCPQPLPPVAPLAERVRHLLEAMLTGYTMSLQRLARTLQQYELEPIPCAGQPFDPELMEVVEVLPDTGRPANTVIDEVRRGYLWRGRVFRYAQVRVAQPGGARDGADRRD